MVAIVAGMKVVIIVFEYEGLAKRKSALLCAPKVVSKRKCVKSLLLPGPGRFPKNRLLPSGFVPMSELRNGQDALRLVDKDDVVNVNAIERRVIMSDKRGEIEGGDRR